jgi:hypothetical protein
MKGWHANITSLKKVNEDYTVLDEDSQDASLIRALRSRGVDVISASESGMNGRSTNKLQWSSTPLDL